MISQSLKPMANYKQHVNILVKKFPNEAGNLKIDNDCKLEGCEESHMFVGYLHNNDGNCYYMHNPKTKHKTEMRGMVMVKHMYYQKEEIPDV